jgi:hypothetical protein
MLVRFGFEAERRLFAGLDGSMDRMVACYPASVYTGVSILPDDRKDCGTSLEPLILVEEFSFAPSFSLI